MDKESALELASKYISYLKENNYDIVKAILFGSFAKGDFDNDSDIDIAVIFKNLDDKFKTQVKLFMLTPKFDTRIEPHPIDINDFNHNNQFAHEIIKYGIEIT